MSHDASNTKASAGWSCFSSSNPTSSSQPLPSVCGFTLYTPEFYESKGLEKESGTRDSTPASARGDDLCTVIEEIRTQGQVN